MSLFETWLELEIAEQGTQTLALRAINAACGTRYQHNWVSQQRKDGSRPGERTPLVVRRYMLRRVLETKLTPLGVPREAVDEWVDFLS